MTASQTLDTEGQLCHKGLRLRVYIYIYTHIHHYMCTHDMYIYVYIYMYMIYDDYPIWVCAPNLDRRHVCLVLTLFVQFSARKTTWAASGACWGWMRLFDERRGICWRKLDMSWRNFIWRWSHFNDYIITMEYTMLMGRNSLISPSYDFITWISHLINMILITIGIY